MKGLEPIHLMAQHPKCCSATSYDTSGNDYKYCSILYINYRQLHSVSREIPYYRTLLFCVGTFKPPTLCKIIYSLVEQCSYALHPPDFQSGASTKLASVPIRAENRNRTCNRRITNPLLYQLSYLGIIKSIIKLINAITPIQKNIGIKKGVISIIINATDKIDTNKMNKPITKSIILIQFYNSCESISFYF